MTENYRKLNLLKKKILEKFFEKEFPGRVELQEQINSSKVKPISEYGDSWGSVDIKTNLDNGANVESRIPVQGVLMDTDGVPIEIFLHVIDGFVNELEIIKADNSPLKAALNPKNMRVLVYSEIKKD